MNQQIKPTMAMMGGLFQQAEKYDSVKVIKSTGGEDDSRIYTCFIRSGKVEYIGLSFSTSVEAMQDALDLAQGKVQGEKV